MDVGENTTRSDRDASEELVKLFVVADGKLDVPGDDAAPLVVAGGVAGKLEDLSSEVLHNCGKVHGGTGTNALGVSALAQVARDTADGELKSRLGALGRGLATLLATSSFSFSGHFVVWCCLCVGCVCVFKTCLIVVNKQRKRKEKENRELWRGSK